jgi:30S ribosomal protein S31
MGRGDKRSRRGKIFKGSYGNTRTHKTEAVNKPSAASTATAAKKAPAGKKSK